MLKLNLNTMTRRPTCLVLAAATSLFFLQALASSEPQGYWSGGVAGDKSLCPKTPLDTLVNPNADIETDVPTMTVEGVWDYIQQHQIQTIDDLVEHLPLHYKTNFSLVEHTRATGQSNIDRPRIVMFGSDGRFLLNVGTKEDDPNYHVLDVAELDPHSGLWEFSLFDFRKASPQLVRNEPDCLRCHGHNYARPVWGTNLDWPGVFGDNIAEGPNGEALDTAHLLKLREFKAGNTGSRRLDTLVWSPQPMHRGGIRKVAHHIMGGELLLSNIAMGSANALGVFKRIQQIDPQRYQHSREDLLLAMLERMSPKSTPKAWRHRLQQQAEAEQIPQAVQDLGVFDILMFSLGVDTRDAFSLATLADTEAPDTQWEMGSGDLYEQVAMQVLWDLAQQNASIADLLKTTAVGKPVFACHHVATNVWDIIQYKQLHLYELAGQQRFNVNRVYFAADAEDIVDAVFEPIQQSLMSLLLAQGNTAKVAALGD